MKESSRDATAFVDDDLSVEEIGELIPDDSFAPLDDLDLGALTVSDLAALKDTVFRSALVEIATMPEISLQVSHQNGTHSSHTDHVQHQQTGGGPKPEEPINN